MRNSSVHIATCASPPRRLVHLPIQIIRSSLAQRPRHGSRPHAEAFNNCCLLASSASSLLPLPPPP
uniref:Uncharacterized protein n=1 Tax=Mesocestoides corti TaxID=53468 RepID=A0A5K3G3G1_MESCO